MEGVKQHTKTKRQNVVPAKKTAKVKLSRRRVEASEVVKFAKEFYAKHGRVMSKLAHE